jgi:hypothetical protein
VLLVTPPPVDPGRALRCLGCKALAENAAIHTLELPLRYPVCSRRSEPDPKQKAKG